MEPLELIMQTDLETAIPRAILFNYDELKSQLAGILDKYNNLVVTEDAIQPAKKYRASLNKFKAAFDDKRKDVKKACLTPYEDFEAKIKELTGMVQEPIDAIDRQVKGYEEQKRRDKYASIERFYNDNIKELRELVPLEKILPSKWANAGIEFIAVTQEMMSAISKIKNELGIIQKMGLPFETQIVDTYLKTLDMGAALAEKHRLEEQAKALDAARKQHESEKAVEAEPATIQEVSAKPVQAVSAPVAAPQIEEVRAYDFRAYMTDAQKTALRTFLVENSIKYERIPLDNERRIIPWQSKTA